MHSKAKYNYICIRLYDPTHLVKYIDKFEVDGGRDGGREGGGEMGRGGDYGYLKKYTLPAVFLIYFSLPAAP